MLEAFLQRCIPHSQATVSLSSWLPLLLLMQLMLALKSERRYARPHTELFLVFVCGFTCALQPLASSFHTLGFISRRRQCGREHAVFTH